MRTVWRVLVGWLLTALSLAAALAPASAATFTVNSDNYTQTETVSVGSFDSYELTAQSGQHVKYTLTVTSGCASLFFVKGHNVNAQSQYYVSYSQENCVTSYSNDFPVASSDGTTFSVMVATTSGSADYTVTIQKYTPAIPDWVLGLVVFIVIVVVLGVIRAAIRRRRAPPIAQPPMQPPMQPPQGGQTPPSP